MIRLLGKSHLCSAEHIKHKGRETISSNFRFFLSPHMPIPFYVKFYDLVNDVFINWLGFPCDSYVFLVGFCYQCCRICHI